MKNETLLRIMGMELSNRIYEELDKEEVDDISYVDNILSDFFSVLVPNEDILELSYKNGSEDFIKQQIMTNSQVDFNQLFRSLFRCHQEYNRFYEEGNELYSTIMICSSISIINEMIERLYND